MSRSQVTDCRKLFVLDTNVILHDAGCIERFEENDIAIPISVLEELDQFKKGSQDIHFQAREFLRRLDQLTDDVLAAEGASLGPDRGSIRIVLHGNGEDRLQSVFLRDCPDHRILSAALTLQQQFPGRLVVLVTKDTNLRLKARSLDLPAEDYSSDKVEGLDKLYSGKRTINNLPSESIESFYGNGGIAKSSLFPEIADPIANENFILRNGSKSALARYRAADQSFLRVEKMTAYGIAPRNAEQSFALGVLSDPEIRLVTLAGKAGTGKTLLALAAALQCRSHYRQILLARPVVPLSNRDLGYLPGDISAKLDPYMQPLYDNLAVIRHQFDEADQSSLRIQKMLECEKLVISPLAYIRGRSLQRIFFIVDEAQNLTPHEVKTIITRAGEGTKIVFTGDIHQIDHAYLDSLSNGLSYLISRMVGQSLYAHVTLEKGERSELADLASDLL
ncbi:MAG: PhoH family protein [Pirellulaceae bacterium]|nr:PhoH family protein [Pirellulaceae bacterium]